MLASFFSELCFVQIREGDSLVEMESGVDAPIEEQLCRAGKTLTDRSVKESNQACCDDGALQFDSGICYAIFNQVHDRIRSSKIHSSKSLID